MKSRESIIKDSTYYLSSSFIGQAISFLRGIVVRSILGPLNYGWLNIFTLIERYAGYTDLGLINAMDREVPLSRGRKDNIKEKEIENNVFSFILFSGMVIALAIFIYSLVSKKAFFSNFSFTLKIFAVFLVLYRLTTFFSIFLRTHRKFRLLSQLNVLRGTAALIFIVFLAGKYRIAGVFVAEIAALIIFIILCIKGFSHPFSFTLKLCPIRRLIALGFPLLLISLTAVTLRNLDRLMIITLLKEPLFLGYYSAGLLFSNTIVQIPDSISVILFPRLLEDFGRSPDISKIKKYVEEPTIILACLMGVIISLAVIVSPFFLKYILPKYQPGLAPLRILCAGAFFMSLVNMSGHFLIAINKQHRLLAIGGLTIISGIFLCIIFTKLGMGLVGIAVAMALIYFLYNTAVVGYALRHFQKRRRDTFAFFLKIYFPFIYFAPCVVFLHRLGSFSGSWAEDLIVTVIRMAVLLLLSVPFFIYLERNYSIFRGLKKAICRG